MSVVDTGEFACEACGKTYKWKEQYAGRKVQCGCGHVMRCPDMSPANQAPQPPQGNGNGNGGTKSNMGRHVVRAKPAVVDTYDVKPDPVLDEKKKRPVLKPCPSCETPMQPELSVCLNCGFNTITGKMPRKGGMFGWIFGGKKKTAKA